MLTFAANIFITMKPYPGNNIARKENGTSISHVVFGQETNCPTDSLCALDKAQYRERRYNYDL